jgi:adenylate kinase
MLGPPGAGKGTQARRLAESRGVPHISTGEILRAAVEANTDLGRKAKAVIESGRLVSDEIMIGIVNDRLDNDDAREGFLLDGFPRTVFQADALDNILGGRQPLVVIDLSVNDDELVRRLSTRRMCESCGVITGAVSGKPAVVCDTCGGALKQRSDDREEVVRERLVVYRQSTEPLIGYYQRRPTFRSVDGSQDEESVAALVGAAVDGVTS